ncbi:MAG: riboflavin synthase [Candidatus Thermoplasmatota archaeon]|nr:riboflavin synthase [Candidatus Thermoplasmatota archaeon]
MKKIGIADTTFARYDMYESAVDELSRIGTGYEIERYTVPGIKDLAIASQKLIDSGCDIVMALGMPGPEPIDKQCADQASKALLYVELKKNTHIIEVFVHEDEVEEEKDLADLADKRAREHAENVYDLLFRPERLEEEAGRGEREGFPDVGPLR